MKTEAQIIRELMESLLKAGPISLDEIYDEEPKREGKEFHMPAQHSTYDQLLDLLVTRGHPLNIDEQVDQIRIRHFLDASDQRAPLILPEFFIKIVEDADDFIFAVNHVEKKALNFYLGHIFLT